MKAADALDTHRTIQHRAARFTVTWLNLQLCMAHCFHRYHFLPCLDSAVALADRTIVGSRLRVSCAKDFATNGISSDTGKTVCIKGVISPVRGALGRSWAVYKAVLYPPLQGRFYLSWRHVEVHRGKNPARYTECTFFPSSLARWKTEFYPLLAPLSTNSNPTLQVWVLSKSISKVEQK